MLDMFEKLINEHGSSVILKERLELFSDKYSMLEDKNIHLEQKNKDLEEKLKESKLEIKRLQNIVKSQADNDSSSDLIEVEINILKLMFKNNHEYEATQIAGEFSIDIGHAEHYLNNLVLKELIDKSSIMIENAIYFITPNGRTYVVKNT